MAHTTHWLVPLTGHIFELEDLPIYLQSHTCPVVRKDGTYYLKIPNAKLMDDPARVVAEAEAQLELVRGALRIIDADFSTLGIQHGSIQGVDANEAATAPVIMPGVDEIRMKAYAPTISIGGVSQEDARTDSLTMLLKPAEYSQKLRDALAIIGQKTPTWPELYVVFELARDHIGRSMYTKNGITVSDVELFTRTANSYPSIGRNSRHGPKEWKPPAKPMEYADALILIRNLVKHWLDETSPTPSDTASSRTEDR